MTHTYAVLEVSPSAYTEIKALLAEAGYGHAFDGDIIDMHGIALKALPILDDVRAMGRYVGLSPIEGASRLIAVHEGNREDARQVAATRAYNHPDTIVRKWWEQVAIAIEGWKDKQPPRAISQSDGHA